MDMQALMPRPTISKNGKLCCGKKMKSGPWLEGTLNSEYRKEFLEKEVPLSTKSFKPLELPKVPGAKFDANTTYEGDFTLIHPARRAPIRPRHSQAVENLRFEGVSAYQSQFEYKGIPYERVKAPSVYEPTQAPLSTDTTYTGDYAVRAVPLPPSMIKRGSNLELGGKFDAQSMYKATFVNLPPAKRDPALPVPGGQVVPQGSFDAGTVYRSHFLPMESSRPAQFKPTDAGAMNNTNWDGENLTEYKGQFMNKGIRANPAAKPLTSSEVIPMGRLDTSTTYGGDFKQKAIGRIPPIRPDNAIKPETLPFNGRSSYADSFLPKVVPYERVRASLSFEPSLAKFDETTTSGEAYRAYQNVPGYRGVPRMGGIKKDEQGIFDGRSTYKQDFMQLPGERAVPKPPPVAVLPDASFDGTTIYRADFVEKELPVRPAPCVECDSEGEEV
ncbi:hypothetical protein CEUSTIGMA_g5368.t1 [Chlamydomonas eustigma]|uniref:Uncharacterized protein n=1 Tax=Chlamydomonas eustigma TaxID=1157962 RepID=A0A250X4E2_9CHLO|nr:hypothetical protein CEUSTIGMA_g5368.t1 [Chlamydomonas eustigma]|eukprot:GAX77926.1 hypothetical protein CEUSTIGMA_g5368.t1 [Chlamydomonas eustigma]